MSKTTIFTDGSSRGNPGRGGWGAIVVTDNEVIELGGREEHTTNNRMELMAAIEGILAVKTEVGMVINTDSSYVINGITKWVNGWKRNGWLTKTKDEVLNKDLWERLVDAKEGKEIEWNYVGGHSGIKGNERCDEIATSFADGNPVNLYKGEITKYHIKDILDLSNITEKVQKKTNSKAKAYSYVSMVDGKIMTHKTWSECEERVKGKSNTRYRKAISLDQEQQIIEEFSKY